MPKGKSTLIVASTTSTQNSALFDILIPAYEETSPCDVRYREAMDFIAFVTSPEGQRYIAGYKKHGVNLFYPDAVPSVLNKKK